MRIVRLNWIPPGPSSMTSLLICPLSKCCRVLTIFQQSIFNSNPPCKFLNTYPILSLIIPEAFNIVSMFVYSVKSSVFNKNSNDDGFYWSVIFRLLRGFPHFSLMSSHGIPMLKSSDEILANYHTKAYIFNFYYLYLMWCSGYRVCLWISCCKLLGSNPAQTLYFS